MDKPDNKEYKKSNWAGKEEEILSFWNDNKIFQKTLKKNEGKKHFVFYDGPPFATGTPHYGHLLASIIKDAIPRYQTMKGKYVRRKWGWDCHGLPVETLIEGELGLEHKKDIEKYGINKFNKAAKDSVLRYDKEWKKMIPRIGRWIDMEGGYKTMDYKYTESIWWAFKELYDKGLVYKGYKSMHICPRCETTLSTTEVADGYKDITDISVIAKFELVDEQGTYVLAWTTTPWTLPGNVALAVGDNIEYMKVKYEDSHYIIAKERVGDVFSDKDYSVKKEMKGSELIGKSYKPVFDYYLKNKQLENHKNGWKIYSADFVTTESGTGVVHIAPAFGEDDMNLGEKYSLPFVQHVTFDGRFKNEVKDFAGQYVKPKDNHQATDIEIIKYLAHKNILFSKLKIKHSYPHCWRCDTPLLNYATSSWFIKVTDIKEKLVELNKKVNWVPETIGSGRFGNWLENARDWSISRTRFWGAPLPVWECGKCKDRKVIGSIKDILDNSKKRNTYFLMRHGESESNVNNIIDAGNNKNNHLTENGKEQVLKTAKQLKNKDINLIVYSPVIRTEETANIIAKEIGLSDRDVIADERIKEINTGIFDGKPVADYRCYFNSLKEKLTKKPEGGENVTDVKRRVMEFIDEIDKNNEGKNILIVSHEYPLWAITAGASGMNKEETVRIKEETGDDFIGNANVKEVSFSPFPHNEDWELDLHRPYIDTITFNCKCGSKMKRIQDVFDCWVESGSMPFAQFHYPFENKKEFKNNFPADFIAEGIDQTRGWFYTMLVLSAGLFDKTPYKNVIVNGLIMAEDGKKMSKKLKNYPEPMSIVHKYSADALRVYMLSSPVVHAEELKFSESGVDEVQKKIIGRLLNVLSFYKLYEDKNIKAESESKNLLDKWIVAKFYDTGLSIEKSLDKYELDKAVRPIGEFVDDLSTWYLRRSRGRFKGEDVKDKACALSTMRFVLTEFAKTTAPFMPFVSEHIYKEVGGSMQSVHMEEWFKMSFLDKIKHRNKDILNNMDKVRDIVSLGLEARASSGIKVRQPLRMLKVKGQELEDGFVGLIKDEVNVKDVVFDETIKENIELDTTITNELKKEGQFRELIRFIQDMRKKEKFTPNDLAVITIETSSEGESLVNHFMENLKTATPVKSVDFNKVLEGEDVSIGGMVFKIEISK